MICSHENCNIFIQEKDVYCRVHRELIEKEAEVHIQIHSQTNHNRPKRNRKRRSDSGRPEAILTPEGKVATGMGLSRLKRMDYEAWKIRQLQEQLKQAEQQTN